MGPEGQDGIRSPRRAPDGPAHYPQPPKCDPPIAGVYVVFGPRGVYVGESGNVLQRLWHVIACGFDWTIVKYFQKSSHGLRRRWEAAVIRRYLELGIPVVSHEVLRLPLLLDPAEVERLVVSMRAVARVPQALP